MKETILNLKKEGKTYKEIKEILGCAISTISYHCNNNDMGTKIGLDDKLIEKIKKYYKTHSIEETINEFNISKTTILKYCDSKRVKLTNEERKKKNVSYVQNRRKKIKEMAITYKGGACEECGYNKCYEALEFHHLDPAEKDFSIGSKGYTRSWDKVKKELDKCAMLCANCHREAHSNYLKV